MLPSEVEQQHELPVFTMDEVQEHDDEEKEKTKWQAIPSKGIFKLWILYLYADLSLVAEVSC